MEMRDEKQITYYESRVKAWKDYQEADAKIVKRSEEDRNQARKVYHEAIAQADKVLKEASE